MPSSNQLSQNATASSPSSPLTQQPSSSFIYPAKSLLAGNIQPATERASSTPSTPPSQHSDILFIRSVSHEDLISGALETRAKLIGAPPSSSDAPATSEQQNAIDVSQDNTSASSKVSRSSRPRSISLSSSTDATSFSSEKGKRRKAPRTNFRHFPAGEQTTPRKFSMIEPPSQLPTGTLSSAMNPETSLVAEPVHKVPLPLAAGEALTATAAMLPIVSSPLPTVTQTAVEAARTDYFSIHAHELSLNDTEATALDGSTDQPTPGPAPIQATEDTQQEPEETLPYNLSEYGIVHLPPLPPSVDSSECSSRGASQSPHQVGSRAVSNFGSFSSSNPSSRGSPYGQERKKKTTSLSSRGHSTASSSADFHSFSMSNSPQLRSNSNSGKNSSSGMSFGSSTDDPITTFQFEHVEDQDGHHVVIGREGKLQRCEDEPIRTPGAVQGFGVLMALDDLEDALLVRQVSENATELLGLPPKYLFSLECFTDALPEQQVDVLWDNIHFLTDPDPSSDSDTSSPHVFLLSGWGAPGSAIPGDSNSLDGRRTWTCWCAAHRAEGYSSEDSLNQGLIVIELELERDKLNPLYPIPSASGVSSPADSGPSQTDRLFGGNKSPTSASGSDRTAKASSVYSGSSGTSATPSPQPPASEASISSNFELGGLDGDGDWVPSQDLVTESTTCFSKPIPALERLRRMTRMGSASDAPSPGEGSSKPRRRGRHGRKSRGSTVGMMDVFAVMAQINEQISAAPDLDMFLKIVVGVIKDLTQFHRVMVYQFDELWNGQVVAELVDWHQSHDLFKGLHFPAGDIPAQARALYAINKVRLLYDRSQPTARIVCRAKEDLQIPLDMTHCYLRAMSPIHIQYLENMGVRASMSVSVMAFGQLWGLVTCHTYGRNGMRVSFPVRQMLRLLSESVSRNIERLSYARRLHTRKLVKTLTSEQHPTGYIVSNADDLLGLFDADFGILVVGEGAKILGPNQHGQEILIMAEYLRLKQFDTIQASQSVSADYPDLKLKTGLEVIAGLLYVPLSRGGRDFIAFLRRGQPRHVNWAGRPHKLGQGPKSLEPRTSFKIWSEVVAGRSRSWSDEQLETAGVLALVYGKFIEVWRQKQSAMQNTKLANLILNNASHEVRTPLNHIINYLEMALNGSLDTETRENLSRSHAASKSLLFTINDLLDLTRIESGGEMALNESFNLHTAIEEATYVYKREAERHGLKFTLDLEGSPSMIFGDSRKIRTIVQNLTANALKHTSEGSITVQCATYKEPEGLREANQGAVEIVVADTGSGIEPQKLESIFREFEQVESTEPRSNAECGVGLGLAVVARSVEQLGGQLRVESSFGVGTKFSLLIPLSLDNGQSVYSSASSGRSSRMEDFVRSATGSQHSSEKSEIENLVEALSTNHIHPKEGPRQDETRPGSIGSIGSFPVVDSQTPIRPVRLDPFGNDPPLRSPRFEKENRLGFFSSPPQVSPECRAEPPRLRVLIVEDNDINRSILAKRLKTSGHTVVDTTNGQEGLDMVERDQGFDVVLMDIQMPILDGFQATERIRQVEALPTMAARPSRMLNNGRIPIFAVSASLKETQRENLLEKGMDGWILKPIDFKRLNLILKGVLDPEQRQKDSYTAGFNWERGGWLYDAATASCSGVTSEMAETA
ncbi:hypothetical protein FA15DRAFT_673329 [Coprinopsis marcescibilis]|uniref:Bacteriophytochrome histidine kinase n=1 Tax=Coprinopsis marcescibilis TaxID=230819 RepID=A0A5C3KK94_COPMA|nr:hypothetical protein FA15DRAFT_673329 [Coprinopsis marcescibilis]